MCTTFFRKIIIDAGEQPESFEVNEQEQNLLIFGSMIAPNKGLIPDEIFNAVKMLYTDEQMVVLIAFAGQMNSNQYFQ